jgi:drug/metabolite transporter (DMT)-like permease
VQWNIVLLVLLGAALHASWNALIKSESDHSLNTALIVAGSALIGVFVVPFVPLPLPASWPYLVVSVLIHILYFTLLVLAYQKGELSLIYPLMRGIPPVFTAIAAYLLLNESFSYKGWLGVLLVSGGALSLTADARLSKEFRITPLLFALANAGVIVIYTIVDGTGARLSGNAFSYTGWMLTATACSFLLFLLAFQGRRIAVRIARQWRKSVIGGACTFASYGIALWAMTHAPIALVAALRETSILFGVAFAVLTLKERVTRLRLLSIALIVAGVVAIKLS